MKITYTPNPLRSQVLLDDHDKEVFRLKIKVEELQNRMFSAHFSLTESAYFNVTDAQKHVDPTYYIQEDNEPPTKLEERVDSMFNYYTEALLDTHIGDCTCQPCSCLKCHAEGILGINTLAPYPGSHALSAINGAFAKDRTLAEALVHLKTPISRERPENWRKGNASQEDYEKHIPRWEADRARAYEYLENYAKEHFPQESFLGRSQGK